MDTIDLGRATIYIVRDREELSHAVAERIVVLSGEALADHGRFTVALSGGSTPRSLYGVLASPDYSARVPWGATHLFWGDERCVPPDSADSNYEMVRESLMSKVDLKPGNVHPLSGQDKDPAAAARKYEEELCRTFELSAGAIPRFDLVLLGLGSDGHTASLFPGTAALSERKRLVVENYVDKLSSFRITLTLPVLNAAAHLVFLVAGDDKKEIFPQVVKPEPVLYPAQLVQPPDGKLEWYADRAAAEILLRS